VSKEELLREDDESAPSDTQAKSKPKAKSKAKAISGE